ncbi:MAG: flagellar basal body rod protein FlgB [Lachnospiraceae bacterium]|nr:flagellar basal body rod protein FlgB [Lachnospiraceae bacterium]MCI9282533.1 flagellar basal body rod protein FlgB [Lachnospiraceae bacterium]
MEAIYGNGVALSEKVLDYLWGRQTVSLNNVANVDTPGFKSQYVTFEEEMSRRLARASETERAPKRAVSHAIETSKASLNTTWTESSRLDGNNVDMDQEQVEIVRTAYQYQYMLNSITNDINRLRTAAKTF